MYKPSFIITPEITNWIAQIEAVKQKIERSRILPEQEVILRYKAAIESVYSSTSIEGNPLNEKQVESALSGKMNSWEKKVIEVVNYKKAWDWIGKRAKNKSKISLKDTFRLHTLVTDKLLPDDKIGQIRSGPIYIVDSKENIIYIGPESRQVKRLINELLTWLNKQKNKLHPVLLSGLLHYEFVSIHPFPDGNGRVTRLLVKLFLESIGYDFRGSLSLDTFYWQNISGYYQALNQAKTYEKQSKADLTKWLTYFIKGFYLVVKELERKIDILSVSSRGKMLKLSDEEIRILDFIKQFGQINLKETLDILRVPERTGQRRLKTLVYQGLLKKIGKGKITKYILKK